MLSAVAPELVIEGEPRSTAEIPTEELWLETLGLEHVRHLAHRCPKGFGSLADEDHLAVEEDLKDPALVWQLVDVRSDELVQAGLHELLRMPSRASSRRLVV